MFFDKAAKRAILQQTVKCSNWKKKCDWSGELSSLEVYISYNFNDYHASYMIIYVINIFFRASI